MDAAQLQALERNGALDSHHIQALQHACPPTLGDPGVMLQARVGM